MRLSDNVRVYPAIFSYADDGISVRFPDLPGCLTCGQTDAEALFMAKDALRCYLVMLQDEGEPIPEPTSLRQIRTGEHDRITLVCIGDAEPVRHGEWVSVALVDQKGRVIVEQYKCSLCGRQEYQKEPYCHCGAKMDGGKQDD